MTFSGNSAHYSMDKLKNVSPKFNHLRLVEFCDNKTVTVYHYGTIGCKEIEELKALGRVLVEPMAIHGYDYTENRPIVVVITFGKVYFSHTTAELVSTHPAIQQGLKKLPYFKMLWNSHIPKRRYEQIGIPKIAKIIEPNCDFELEED